MPEIRYSQKCLNCGRRNGKRHSQKGYFWKCRFCDFTNPGPGMRPALDKVFSPTPEPTQSNGRGRPPTLRTAAKKAAGKTVVKVTGKTTPSKTVVPKTPAPKEAVPAGAQSDSWWHRAIYG